MESNRVSKLQNYLSSGMYSILIDIIDKWKEETRQMFTHDEVENALIINHQSTVNMYMHFI